MSVIVNRRRVIRSSSLGPEIKVAPKRIFLNKYNSFTSLVEVSCRYDIVWNAN